MANGLILTSRAFWTLIGKFGTGISALFCVAREIMTRADLEESQTEINMHIDQAIQDTKARIKAKIKGEVGEIKGEVGKVKGELKGRKGEIQGKIESVDRKVEDLAGKIQSLDATIQDCNLQDNLR